MACLKSLSVKLLVVLLISFFHGKSQSITSTQALEILEKIQSTYDNKTEELKFLVTNSYRYACSDSVIQQTKMSYWVKDGDYYITSDRMIFVMTNEFFIAIDHLNKTFIYSNKPSLEYIEYNDLNYLNGLREFLVKESEIKLEKKANGVSKLSILTNKSMANGYDRMELVYSSNYTFQSITYYQKPGVHSPFAQLPNCLKITYTNEAFSAIKKNPFKLTEYITKSKGKWRIQSPYSDYELIKQIEPHE